MKTTITLITIILTSLIFRLKSWGLVFSYIYRHSERSEESPINSLSLDGTNVNCLLYTKKHFHKKFYFNSLERNGP